VRQVLRSTSLADLVQQRRMLGVQPLPQYLGKDD
jgi:hypothetical protein